MTVLLLLAITSLGAAAYYAIEAVTVGSRERRQAVLRASTYGRTHRQRLLPDRDQLRDRAVVPMRDSIARVVLRLTPKLTIDGVSGKLLAAGLTRRISPTGFLALKGGSAIAGTAVAMLLLGNLLLALVLGVAASFAPDIFVTFRTRKRKDEARSQLPDALDILAVSVEAGLAFDGAITKLIEHMRGALAEEFALTLGEMRIGRSRQEALKNLNERMDTPEITNFTRAIIQADQLGISLGKILRVQAADTRMRRQAAAEEKAMKAPIKMIPPTAIFIMPTIFIVVLGPAFLKLGEMF